MSDAITIAAPANLVGSAMHFVLRVAASRARHRPSAEPRLAGTDARSDLSEVMALWELAERYHPEQVWLAESWLRGERTYSELERTAPRGTLAPGFLRAAGPLFPSPSLCDTEPPHDHAKETTL